MILSIFHILWLNNWYGVQGKSLIFYDILMCFSWGVCEIFFGQQQKRKQFRISCQCDILLFRGKNRENSWLWLKSWFFAFKPLLLCIIIILKHNWLGGKILPPFFVCPEKSWLSFWKINFYLPFIRRNQAEQNGTKKVNCTKDFWNNMRTFWRSCEKLGKENHYWRLLWIFIIDHSNQ